MDFDLTEEQQMIQRMASQFSQKKSGQGSGLDQTKGILPKF